MDFALKVVPWEDPKMSIQLQVSCSDHMQADNNSVLLRPRVRAFSVLGFIGSPHVGNLWRTHLRMTRMCVMTHVVDSRPPVGATALGHCRTRAVQFDDPGVL